MDASAAAWTLKVEESPTTFDPEAWRTELRVFAARMGAGQEADDVVQETLLRAVRSPPPIHARPWLYRVALNVLRDRSRRVEAERREPVEREPAHFEERAAGPDETAIAREAVQLAWEAVARLPERQRAALILRVQRHMDYDEVALALDCSIATARQHFHLAVKTVRQALAEKPDA